MPNFLAFDLGAESGRAVLGILDGATLRLSEQHRFLQPNGRLNGHLHWNLLTQWEELKTGLRKAAASLPSGQKIAALGVDTWGVDYGLIGEDGQILSNPFMYRDSRTDGAMEQAFAKVSRDRIFQITGIQFMSLNTLFQLFAANRDHPKLIDAAQTLLFMPDLFNYLFTGRRKSELSIASTSQMIDPRTGKWATDLLRDLNLPTHLLPEIIPSATIIGPLRADVAEECGTDLLQVVAPGCHDTASAVAAVPAQGGNWCYISSGTWSLMGVEADRPIINELSARLNYTNEIGVGGKIRFLKNIMGLWLVQECRRALAKAGQEYSYAELTRLASQSTPFKAWISPEHAPFGSPGKMLTKITEFCQQTHQPAPTTPGEFVRTCLESLAMTYRRTLEGLEQILGHKIDVIHIVGGGTQNELLNQMTADACGRPVVAGPVEATAIGNILAQAIAVGQIRTLADARAIVRNSFDVKRYDPRDTAAWDEAYGRFQK
ncbi:MAG: rhamnulokinase [Phycisphaerales bacterium]|jgi:rhamnulokinase|nr:rhamnulokinase [Phycisphaerales bacterium]